MSRITPKKVGLKRPRITANQLGYVVNTLVLYKNNPYHIVAVDKTGTLLTIKKATNALTIRDDVALDKVTMVDKRDPLYHKWGVVPVKADFNRTREEELWSIKALVESTTRVGKDTRRELLINMFRHNMWLGVWLRCCYMEDRDYRLNSSHLRKFKSSKRNKSPMGIMEVLTKLQFHRFTPIQAAIEWVSMLETMDQEVWPIANMVLDHQFGSIGYSDARYAMKEVGCVPWLPNRKEKGLVE